MEYKIAAWTSYGMWAYLVSSAFVSLRPDRISSYTRVPTISSFGTTVVFFLFFSFFFPKTIKGLQTLLRKLQKRKEQIAIRSEDTRFTEKRNTVTERAPSNGKFDWQTHSWRWLSRSNKQYPAHTHASRDKNNWDKLNAGTFLVSFLISTFADTWFQSVQMISFNW